MGERREGRDRRNNEEEEGDDMYTILTCCLTSIVHLSKVRIEDDAMWTRIMAALLRRDGDMENEFQSLIAIQLSLPSSCLHTAPPCLQSSILPSVRPSVGG